MIDDYYGFYKDETGYVVTKNGEYYLHTSTQVSAADIIVRLMADNTSDNDEQNNSYGNVFRRT